MKKELRKIWVLNKYLEDCNELLKEGISKEEKEKLLKIIKKLKISLKRYEKIKKSKN
jgi:hypothetical protein